MQFRHTMWLGLAFRSVCDWLIRKIYNEVFEQIELSESRGQIGL